MRHTLSLLAAVAVGCNAGSDSDGAENLPCGDERPSIGSSVVSAGGPNLVLGLLPEDPDGALHSFAIDVWVDAVVDGAVDTSGTPFSHVASEQMEGSAPGEACAATGGSPVSLIFAPDAHDELVRGTRVELAVQLTDADGLVSDLWIADGCVPEIDGTCP